MNKTFFTKYLAVEGEIKEGDWYETLVIGLPQQRNAGTHPRWSGPKKHIGSPTDKLVQLIPEDHKRKLKLFLCSRDIKIDDKVWNPNTNQYENVVSFNSEVGCISYDSVTLNEALKSCYKVIGEILTPGIVENQEFTEKEIEYLTIK